MKEFVEKLIGRLEEIDRKTFRISPKDAIEIVNQLAEEYKDKVIIDGQYCWQTCSATEHCKECNRLCNGGIDYYENYDCLAEEYNNGWISCSERLPEKYGEYLCCDTYGNFVLGFPSESDTSDTGFIVETEHEYCYDIIAWMELTEKYQKGE